MTSARTESTTRPLLVSDLDGTLVGDCQALARFAAWLSPRRNDLWLAYATGRHWPSIRAALDAAELPGPHAVISAVGTEIHLPGGSPWPGWLDQFDLSHGHRVRAALAGLRWLEPQSSDHQSELKASYTIRGLSAKDRMTITQTLAAGGVEAKLIYSAERYLDVIPAGSGKAAAARFLARTLAVPDDAVLTFGDSGNDIELLTAGFRGTIVANALPELGRPLGGNIYRSPKPYADGVLDGIRHWSTR